MSTSNLYSEWRDFYAERVSSWMSLEELRAECGKLATTDAQSPEVLLIHAMHALEEYVQRDEARVAELERFRAVVQKAMQIHVIDEDAIEWINQRLTFMRGEEA